MKPRPTKIFVCDPDKNPYCDKSDCYINGGFCCLTYNPDFEATFVDKETVEKLSRHTYGSRLPNILRGLYSQNKQSI